CYQKGPSTFGMEILSNTKNFRPNGSTTNRQGIVRNLPSDTSVKGAAVIVLCLVLSGNSCDR
ncbi:hypothetical protein, partial [Lactobacillus helveticus]